MYTQIKKRIMICVYSVDTNEDDWREMKTNVSEMIENEGWTWRNILIIKNRDMPVSYHLSTI